ncbi:hypothetical protein [Nocardia brasiliensis]
MTIFDRASTLPIDADIARVRSLANPAMRGLATAAIGLSTEALELLSRLADRLRAAEELPNGKLVATL